LESILFNDIIDKILENEEGVEKMRFVLDSEICSYKIEEQFLKCIL